MFANASQDLDLNRLLDALLAEQRIAACDALKALERARQHPDKHPLELIAELALADPLHPGQHLSLDALCHWLAGVVGQPFLHIDPLRVDLTQIANLMSAAFAERHGILAVAVDDSSVTVASAQPYRRDWEADLSQALGKRVQRVLASPRQIRQLTPTFFGLAHSLRGAGQPPTPGLGELEQLLELGASQAQADADDQHVVRIVDWILQYAIEQRASDIHLEPRRELGHLRLRIDGLLYPVYAFPAGVALAMVSRLKHLGRMNVAEKRRPQDGRLKSRLADGAQIELRLSTLPTPFGEKLVLRLFDPQLRHETLEHLGLEAPLLTQWKALLQRRQGILLVTGPTGSGKTSTLYASLRHLATPQVNLCSIEDPIERLEPAINQLQVQPGLGLGFADGVRALLRQDPDIIMIGEIRDQETAQVAVQAALTGHLVLSTLHTDDACAAITRLQELKVADYLIRATLLGVMAQRLVRTLCPSCQGMEHTDRPACQTCRGSGFHGRTGLFELLRVGSALRQRITPGADLEALRQQAAADGLHDLRRCGRRLAEQRLTSLEEVLRVCG
ncbi:GspE/PulE family protein [Pseudomonas mosselii]|uniref:GspE/PulE family protein n=1 Tax=unclassified Pseudomonas TaxID=196821 RepID=UPI0020C23608|nr:MULTISPECIES: GspE/PulE family protein [unclassified Pseudomonas]MCP8634125.1 GspE/PulE family protein [Pseudomonas sp. DVZ6]MDC0685992.1 GspE/PulE family protein [Mitsuaria sp. RG]MDD7783954.1 GspE/PulE family protein [Pseudomonas sp. DVZ24]